MSDDKPERASKFGAIIGAFAGAFISAIGSASGGFTDGWSGAILGAILGAIIGERFDPQSRTSNVIGEQRMRDYERLVNGGALRTVADSDWSPCD